MRTGGTNHGQSAVAWRGRRRAFCARPRCSRSSAWRLKDAQRFTLQAAATPCLPSRYAVFAKSGFVDLTIGGTGQRIDGNVHTNCIFKLVGADNVVAGTAETAQGYFIHGDLHDRPLDPYLVAARRRLDAGAHVVGLAEVEPVRQRQVDAMNGRAGCGGDRACEAPGCLRGPVRLAIGPAFTFGTLSEPNLYGYGEPSQLPAGSYIWQWGLQLTSPALRFAGELAIPLGERWELVYGGGSYFACRRAW